MTWINFKIAAEQKNDFDGKPWRKDPVFDHRKASDTNMQFFCHFLQRKMMELSYFFDIIAKDTTVSAMVHTTSFCEAKQYGADALSKHYNLFQVKSQ